MKLRTRLALIAGAVVFLATILDGGLILRLSSRTMLEQVERGAYAESESLFEGFETYCGQFSGGVGLSAAVYYLKSKDEDYTILLQDGKAYYNPTILDPSQIDIQTREARRNDAGLYHGRRLLAYKFSAGALELIHVVDVTDAYLRINRLVMEILLITPAIVAAAVAGTFLLLRRSLRPLGALSEGARSIAAGAYGQRVPESGRDEVGALGRDFNKMAQAVEQHIREVEESEEKKTMFMGSLTHELKTPLTAISGYAQTLRAVKLSEDDREAALAYIYQESKRLDRLSKKMLRLLELDQETELDLEPVAVGDLFQGAVAACSPAAQAKGVCLEAAACQGQVMADRDLLTDVLINLVDNAVKASGEGGIVRLDCRKGAMVVEDQGCGIPEEEIDRLTEPFYMVDKSRSRRSGGAGLGLALAAAILRRDHMGLRIESELGAGTTVYISFTFP